MSHDGADRSMVNCARRLFTVLSLGVAVVLATPVQVRAVSFDLPLDFIAPTQSMWGGGSAATFGYSGSVDLGLASFGYDFGASTGTVSARFPGTLSVGYTPVVSDPGTTSLSLSFLGNGGGGQLKSDMGAWANVWAGPFDILDEDYGLNINTSYTPRIVQQVTGSDSVTVGNLGVDILVAAVGANFAIEKTDRFTATGINSVLAYTLRGSGFTSLMPVSLATDAPLTLDLALTEPGTWDFSFAEIALANVYSLSFDAELNLYERHLGCGFLFLEYCYNEFPLLGIDIYNGSPFALAFNPIGATPGFSIAVGTTPVPEAGTLSLLAVGLVSLTGLIRSTRGGRRHRR